MSKIFIQSEELLRKLVKEAVAEATAHLSNATKNSDAELLSIQEAESYLRVTRQTIRNWEKAGLIKPIRLGRRVLFAKDDLILRLKSG